MKPDPAASDESEPGTRFEAGAPAPRLPMETPSPKPAPKRRIWSETPSVRPAGGPEPRFRFDLAPRDAAPTSRKIAGLDSATARRLHRGDREPDARIDLHGMTAERAHAALVAFIRREFLSGSRLVLVITGKGGRRSDDAVGPRGYGPGQGVLKTLAPIWLDEPALSQMIVGVFRAHQRHGGGGALYVYLRKGPRRG